MPNRAAYDASRIDWDRLKRYAQRVARETKVPLRPPVTYNRRVSTVVPIERRTGGLFGFGVRTEVVNEHRTVDQIIEALAPHWLLDYRHWHREDNRRHGGVRIQETTHAQLYLALLPDGRLVKVVVTEEEVMEFGAMRSGLLRRDFEHSFGEATEWDITPLDFEKRYRESGRHDVGMKIWGDRDPGQRLLRHAKGVGINLALKDLLEGRSP